MLVTKFLADRVDLASRGGGGGGGGGGCNCTRLHPPGYGPVNGTGLRVWESARCEASESVNLL